MELSLTDFRVRLVLKWRVGWAGAEAEASVVGRLLVSTAELKPRACSESAVRRSVSYTRALADCVHSPNGRGGSDSVW